MVHGNTALDAPTLFDAAAHERFETRLADFARAAAARQRSRHANVDLFLRALRGYYATWSVCSRSPLPPLDDRAIAFAVGAYVAVKPARRLVNR